MIDAKGERVFLLLRLCLIGREIEQHIRRRHRTSGKQPSSSGATARVRGAGTGGAAGRLARCEAAARFGSGTASVKLQAGRRRRPS